MIVNWYDIIGDFSFRVAHIPGIQNLLPDYLSRLFSPREREMEEGENNNNQTFSDTQSPALRSSQVTTGPIDMITSPEEERE